MRTNFLILLCIMLSVLAKAQINYQPHTIKVNGTAEKLVEPNEVHLLVYLKEVKERNTQMSMVQARAEFMKVCTQTGVENKDVKLSDANSRLEQKLSLWRKARTEVIQRETYDIKFTDMDKLLSCIEKLDKPFVETLSFGEQTHTEIAQYRKEVKENAAKAAIEKARYLAIASGGEIGKVIFIEELNDINMSTANQYANNIRYQKKTGNAKVNFGFKPLVLRYKVQVICELK